MLAKYFLQTVFKMERREAKCSLCEFKTNQTQTQTQAQVDKIQDHLKTKHDLSLDTDYYIWFEDDGTPATGSSCSGYLHIED